MRASDLFSTIFWIQSFNILYNRCMHTYVSLLNLTEIEITLYKIFVRRFFPFFNDIYIFNILLGKMKFERQLFRKESSYLEKVLPMTMDSCFHPYGHLLTAFFFLYKTFVFHPFHPSTCNPLA